LRISIYCAEEVQHSAQPSRFSRLQHCVFDSAEEDKTVNYLLRQNQYRETEESHFLRHTKNISKRKSSTRRAERESISSQHNSLCHLGRRESEELGRKRASFFIPPKTPTRLQRKFHFGQLMRNANWAPPVASWVSAGYLRLTYKEKNCYFTHAATLYLEREFLPLVIEL
jgi:hypothetical protein